jgi:hypothetical protein
MWKRLFLIGLIAATVGACDDDDDDNEFTIANRSSFAIVEVHIAAINDPTWGPNLLPDILLPGDDLQNEDIPCGDYDVLVIDQNGVNCELSNNRLCFDSEETWVIDNAVLAVCAFAPPRTQPTTSTPIVEAQATRL